MQIFRPGTPNLILCLDHKPLLSLFGDQELASISNPRLFNFKTKSLPFKFEVTYIEGKKHVTPDAFSRRPLDQHTAGHAQVPGEHEQEPLSLKPPYGQVQSGYADSISAPSWVASPTMISCITSQSPTEQELLQSDQLEEFIKGSAIASLTALNHSVTSSSPQSMSAITQSNITVLSWERLEAACKSSPVYQLLLSTISNGAPDDISEWDDKIREYHQHRHVLVVTGQVILLHDRPVIPMALRQEVLEHLHSGHAGVTTMFERAKTTLYWPGYKNDITRHRLSCRVCDQIAPSNPAQPPDYPEQPLYPFHSVCADFFTISGNNYLAICDRYSGWLSILKLAKDDSTHIIRALRNYCCTFGIPVILATDGASVFTSAQMQHFYNHWGITHRLSSAYHPNSNKRAEVGVKSAKRMVRDNTGEDGSLDNDSYARAVLTHRNNPCPTTGLSPAQIILGRVLRDFLPIQLGKFSPRPEWRIAADQRAAALARRHVLKHEQLNQGTKHLPPLNPGDNVAIQDQTGKTPRAWTKTGIIMETLPHNSYTVKVDGSNHVTRRNRQFLRKIIPYRSVQTPDLHSNYPAAEDTKPTIKPPHLRVKWIINPAIERKPEAQSPEAVDTDRRLPTATPAQTTKPGVKPPHLREKWIVNPALKKKQDSVDVSQLKSGQIQLGRGRGHH